MHAAVVDDSAATRTILSNMLIECGLTVHEVADAASALPLLRKHPEIRLILIDWHLPCGGGYELARQIRANPKLAGRRIIMVTAEAGVDDVATAIEAGIDEYVTKPFSLQSIREKIDLLGVMAA